MADCFPRHFPGFHPHLGLAALGLFLPWLAAAQPVLNPETFRRYVEDFNWKDRETVTNHISNAAAWSWMATNVPIFECPDKDIEAIYHFRWWTYRKHIKQTPDGFVVTEFLPEVSWSKKHNTINCPVGHHLYEGRWIRDPRYLDDYTRTASSFNQPARPASAGNWGSPWKFANAAHLRAGGSEAPERCNHITRRLRLDTGPALWPAKTPFCHRPILPRGSIRLSLQIEEAG